MTTAVVAAAAAPGAALVRLQLAPPAATGWQRYGATGGAGGGAGAAQRDVAAAAKRRPPSNPGRSSAGGGGRGRSLPRDRAAVKELSVALQDGRQRGSGSGSAGFASGRRSRRRGRGRGGSGDEASDTDGEPEWDEELLAELSDSGKLLACTIQALPGPVAASSGCQGAARCCLVWVWTGWVGAVGGQLICCWPNTLPLRGRTLLFFPCQAHRAVLVLASGLSVLCVDACVTGLPPPPHITEVAELIGEGEAGEGDLEAMLAGESAEVAAAVRAVLGQFTFQLDTFQARAVTRLLAGKSGKRKGG